MLLDIPLAVGIFHEADYVFIKLLLFIFPHFVAQGIIQHHVQILRLIAGNAVRQGLAVACGSHVHTEEMIDQAALSHTGTTGHKDARLFNVLAYLVQYFVVIKILQFID